MAIIRPALIESFFTTFYSLDSERMYYYNNVVSVAKDIFINMGASEYVEELDKVIYKWVEKPLNIKFIPLTQAYYTPRVMFYKNAYIRVGDLIHGRDVTRFEIQMRLEKVKDFAREKVNELSRYVRFTNQQQILPQ